MGVILPLQSNVSDSSLSILSLRGRLMLDSKGSCNQPLHERLPQCCASRAAVVYARDISDMRCHFQKLGAKRREHNGEAGVLHGLTAMFTGAVVQGISKA